jgi:hypothetical protein
MPSASGTSEFEIISNPDSSPERPQVCPNTLIEDEFSTIRPSTPSTIVGNGPWHALTLENLSLKEIDEVAGGSIQTYKQLLIADLKRKRGLAFTADSAIPAPGELIGDKQSGYATMSLEPSSGPGGLRRNFKSLRLRSSGRSWRSLVSKRPMLSQLE